jgi:hypothetical protein
MPRINRDNTNTKQAVLLIHNGSGDHKILDTTPLANIRNYKYSLKQKVNNGLGKHNIVCRYLKENKLDVNDFRVEHLETFIGSYNQVVERMTEISNKLAIYSRYSLTPHALKIKEQLEHEQSKVCITEQEEQELTQKTQVAIKKTNTEKVLKHEQVKCECGKFVIRMNMPRHKKTDFHKTWENGNNECVSPSVPLITETVAEETETHEIIV